MGFFEGILEKRVDDKKKDASKTSGAEVVSLPVAEIEFPDASVGKIDNATGELPSKKTLGVVGAESGPKKKDWSKGFYTLEETLEQLNIDEPRLRRLAEEGEIRVFLEGDKRKFKGRDINILMGRDPDYDPADALNDPAASEGVQKETEKSSEGGREVVAQAATAAAEVAAEALGTDKKEVREAVSAYLENNPEDAAEISAGVAALEANVRRAADNAGAFDAMAESASVETKRSRVKEFGAFLGRLLTRGADLLHEKAFGKEGYAGGVKERVETLIAPALEAAGNVESVAQAEPLKSAVSAGLNMQRQEVLADGKDARYWAPEAIKMAQQRLRELMKAGEKSPGIKGLERAQAYFEKLKNEDEKVPDGKEILANFTYDGKPMTQEQIGDHLNAFIAASVNTKIDKEIERVFQNNRGQYMKQGTLPRALFQIANAMQPYLEMERLGSKRGKEVRTFVTKLILAKRDGMRETEGRTPEVVLLNSYIKRINPPRK